MKHTYSTNPELCACSVHLFYRDSDIVVISAGLEGEVHAEQILAAALTGHGLTLAQAPVVIWSTPAASSVNGAPLLRRLFLDEVNLEWGPDVAFTDAPEIHAAAARCNADLEHTVAG